MANDLTFELVAQGDSVMLYVSDHGKPMAIAGISGKLTILTGSQKSEAQFIPAGDKLEAKGVKLVSGTKAVATLDTPTKKAITVRFTVK